MKLLKNKSNLVIKGGIATVLLVALIVVLIIGSKGKSQTDTVLTIDNYPVSSEEFQLFLNQERALVSAYYFTEFGVSLSDEQWTQNIENVVPLELAKQRALDKLLAAKQEALLCLERGLIDDVSFKASMKALKDTNSANSENQKSGIPIYGISNYDKSTFYEYEREKRYSLLMQSQLEISEPSEDELNRLMQETPQLFESDPLITFEVKYSNDTTETFSYSQTTIGKEDYETSALLADLAQQDIGQTLEGVYRGNSAQITVKDIDYSANQSLEAQMSTLRQLYAEKELAIILDKRVDAAKVDIVDGKYKKIKF
ncbi:MAG: hypothetical protein RR654_07460 [Oscillospiraceae bacterium]